MDCPKCSTPLVADSRFCHRCGSGLPGVAGANTTMTLVRVILAAFVAVVSLVFGAAGSCFVLVGASGGMDASLLMISGVLFVLALAGIVAVIKLISGAGRVG